MAHARLIRRAAITAILLIVVVGIAAPFVNADRFGNRIRAALERSLGRKVQIGRVHFSLFTGPGFTIDDVLIYEDPRFGVEPFAHVLQLDTRLGLASIWTGRLSFSTLRLNEPSVNLVRRSEGGWNMVALVERAGDADAQRSSGFAGTLPTIEIRSGRLYFKRDETKSSFYLIDVDADISLRRGGLGGFEMRFTAGPARSDRPAQAFATLRGEGRLQPHPDREPSAELDLELERAGMDEIFALVRGENSGIHGSLTSRARISGPLSAMKLTGQMRIDDVHRWDLMPRGGGWNLKYSGIVDWRNQMASLAFKPEDNPGIPVSGTLTLYSFLSRPETHIQIDVAALPAANVIEFGRHLGAPIPADISMDGKLNGTIARGSDSNWHGALVLDESGLGLAKNAQLKLSRTEIILDHGKVNIGPASVTGADGESAGIEAVYDVPAGALDLNVKARLMSIAEMQSESGHLLTAASVPLLEGLQRGRWSGELRYQTQQGGPGQWIGNIELRDVQTALPGMADPVRIRSAMARIAGQRLQLSRMRIRAGEIDAFGDYRYVPDDERPHQFSFVIPEVAAAEIERLFLPALRREQGLIARTLRLKPTPAPEWIQDRHAEGTVRVGSLTGGPVDVRGLRATLTWDGTAITVVAREAKLWDGTLRGTMDVDVSGTAPRYRIEASLKDGGWSDGRVDVQGTIDTRGTGLEWLAGLRAKGTFQARGLSVLPENPLRSASGDFTLSMSRSGPVLNLSGLQASTGAENYTGEAATQSDGTFRVDLASTRGTSMQFVGPLAPLKLELAQSKP